MKKCNKCGEKKPLSEYNDTVILTKRGDCKLCESEYTKAYYLKNRERILARTKVRDAHRRGELKKERDKLNY